MVVNRELYVKYISKFYIINKANGCTNDSFLDSQ